MSAILKFVSKEKIIKINKTKQNKTEQNKTKTKTKQKNTFF